MGKTFRVLAALACFGAAGAVAWQVLPENLTAPNREASPAQYSQVTSILTGYSADACPAIRMEAAKAMNDRLLTVREVADLKEKAQTYARDAEAASTKNETLQAAGQKANIPVIDCPRGLTLFTE